MDLLGLYILIGLACGIFSALFGVGSGIIMVPALVLIASLPQKSAQGMALAIMVPMALTGAIRYKMNPDVEMDLKMMTFLAIGGVAGALLGAWLVARIPGLVLKKVFAIILIVAAVKMFFTPEPKKAGPDSSAAEPAAEQAVSEPGPSEKSPAP